ncbi:hypothetical protein LTR05_003067 [Lithohypha guttulata]|uniref:NB-ARC domain-containing protein n=1 Tax=Lithohypha guttulata TaxID=1690604 RepID=A0AAN7YCV7_9EURO|nr:hypothetical protein LTR05_003067 [Lithohypha guttulata]
MAQEKASPIWDRAVERYKEELAEEDVYNAVLKEAGTLQDVLSDARNLEMHVHPRSTLLSFRSFGPTLKFIDDFSAMVAICFGANIQATALIWGSIRLILSLAHKASEKLQSVLEMLTQLSLNMPKFRNYERTLPMTPGLESSLLELYTEIICCYARFIYFFKKNPHVAFQRQAWGAFENDFQSTLRRIMRISAQVESEAELARLNMETARYQELLEVFRELKAAKKVEEEGARAKCYVVPQDPDIRFSGRDDALDQIANTLSPNNTTQDLRTFSLYGMGGVGKTQIALQYAKQSKTVFDATIWIAAETAYSISQSARNACQMLNLISTESELKDISGAVTKLRSWLRDSGKCDEA